MLLILFGILLIGLGPLMLVRPDVFYEITEGWKNNDCGTLSGLYILSTRIGGVAMLAVGLAGVLAQLFL